MKIDNTERTTRDEEAVFLTADLSGEPLVYGHRTVRRWQPTGLRATLRRHRVNGGSWSTWDASHVIMTGHHLRKDGSAGAEREDRLWDWAEMPYVREWLEPFLSAG